MSDETQALPGADMLLPDRFVAVAERWPQQVAVDVPPGPGRERRQNWTYRELANAAASVRRELAAHVTREGLVAILLSRHTPWLYAAQLGAMQSGAGYVALDPSLPDEHLWHVLRDSGATALVSDAEGEQRLRDANCELPAVVSVQTLGTEAARVVPAPAWLGLDSLAYAIYTSGTTGKPKAVLLTHRGIANLVAADLDTFALQPGTRVAQGSSPAYDSSVEESWLAFAAGGTVVVMDDDAARLGPDLVKWLRDERIAVFCPPPTQLRAMACVDPGRELPLLRLLYVGGEALSQDLADLWADACWLENGYGPTECSVTVVRGRVRRGESVTIGKPVAGHRAFVLDDQLRMVTNGEAGELCIAGPGLARGYLGQPELTAERFPVHAQFGRIYRTGDLVQVDEHGDLVCLGRIDTQVKLRGYRIELEAIEAVLTKCDGVRQAACQLFGSGADARLVAFVVGKHSEATLDFAVLRDRLAAELPGYMVPSRLVMASTLPTTVGGKLDRRALREPSAEPRASSAEVEEPRDELEGMLWRSLEGILANARSVSVGEDFFAAGGDSLRAAQWISKLRAVPSTAMLTVRDVYVARTIAALADLARAAGPAAAGANPTERAPRSTRFVGVLVGQVIWLCVAVWVASVGFYVAGFEVFPYLLQRLGPVELALWSPVLAMVAVSAYTGFAIGVAVLGKRVFLGACTPGRVPVGSLQFLRHWLAQQAVRLVPWGLLQGTELQCVVLRWLGARIGKRVHLHRGADLQQGGWDLLDIGDDVAIGQDATLLTSALEDGHLVVAPITIGNGSTIEVRACVSGDASLGECAHLAPSAWLPPHAHVGDGESWNGIPAACVGQSPPVAEGVHGRELSVHTYGACTFLARAMLSLLLALPPVVALAFGFSAFGVDSAEVAQWLLQPWSWVLWMVLLAPALALPFELLWSALLTRWLAPASGQVPVRSVAHVRIQLATGLVHAAGEWISGTLFWPWWLRIAGMRLGARCEISTILDTVPRHVEIGGDTFFADGIYLAGPRVHRGVVSLLPTRVGQNTFLGNHAIVPIGQSLSDDMLLGVSTVADDRVMSRGTDWFGLPPFALPRREVVTVDRSLTHEPSLIRRINRLFWESLRALLPCVPVFLGVVWYAAIAQAEGTSWWYRAGWFVPLLTVVAAVVACACVLVLKWALLGRVRPGQHALWSCWCSRWDFFYVAWHRIARPLLARLEGTLLLPWYLRAMGAQIGRRTVLGSGFAQLVDPDMIHIEDHATVDAQFQAHSFEDRVLKIDHLHIRSGASVAHGTVLLYGADLGAHSCVAPQSVVMKDEHLLPGRRYEGFPVRTVAAATGRAAVVRPASDGRNPR
jgi:non-ribosomal peptide synthetase-like protein